MKTYYASPERSTNDEILAEIKTIHSSPVITGLLNMVSGLLVVVNQHRQIVACNNTFLKTLNISNPEKVLGLRPGEALCCTHVIKSKMDCGTTEFCSTCGAAIAMVASQETNKPVEKICNISINKIEKTIDLVFSVRAQPITVTNAPFLLLFLQDITAYQQKAALERTFLHDISNMIASLAGASELLCENLHQNEKLAQDLFRMVQRLHQEVSIQKKLLKNSTHICQPIWTRTSSGQIVRELEMFYKNHPATENKIIEFDEGPDDLYLTTDISLAMRVLCNMLTNALEAADPNEKIKVWVEQVDSQVRFNVKNMRIIPDDIARRIFERNFSTKSESESGRGIGTYSMKLFGEKILGGQVDFSSSHATGTIFTFSLPATPC